MTSASPAKRFDLKNLRMRALSATVLIPTVLAAVWIGGWAMLVMVAAAAVLLAREWGPLAGGASPRRVSIVVAAAVLIAVAACALDHYRIAWALLLAGAVAAAFAARGAVERRADAAYGVIYIGPACLAVLWLRNFTEGAHWTYMVFAITWAADIMAYVCGSLLRGPKLWPRISPKKTWSGFIGGLVFSMLAAMGVSELFQMTIGLPGAAAVGLAGGLATMGGDLWESMIKRRFGVKDSGDLIPGHGGLMDRVDGLLFCIMVVAAARLIDFIGWGH